MLYARDMFNIVLQSNDSKGSTMKTMHLILAAGGSLAVSACVVEAPSNSGGSSSTGGTPGAAEQACLAAVTRASNNPDVVLLGSQPSSAGTAVRVGVGGQRAPWACTAYRDGSVGEVMFLGGESDGAATQLPDSAPGRPAVGSEYDLSEFEGARAGQAEGGIRALGYEPVRTEGLTTYYFNRQTGACARITTSDGRYSAVKMLPAQDC